MPEEAARNGAGPKSIFVISTLHNRHKMDGVGSDAIHFPLSNYPWTAALGDNLTVHMNRPIGWTLSSQYINKPPDSLSEGIKVYAAAIPR